MFLSMSICVPGALKHLVCLCSESSCQEVLSSHTAIGRFGETKTPESLRMLATTRSDQRNGEVEGVSFFQGCTG